MPVFSKHASKKPQEKQRTALGRALAKKADFEAYRRKMPLLQKAQQESGRAYKSKTYF